MREQAKGIDKELWQTVLADIQTLKRAAPDPKDEDLYKSGLDERKKGAISQYEFAFQIAQTSFAYEIEQDNKYLEAAKKWTLAACEMPIWGYTYNKPNVDLPARASALCRCLRLRCFVRQANKKRKRNHQK